MASSMTSGKRKAGGNLASRTKSYKEGKQDGSRKAPGSQKK